MSAGTAPDAFAVVIVTHNRRAELVECLSSIYASSRLPDEVIVVDNGSVDDTVEAVRSRFPHVRLLEMGENLLPARAANTGVRATSCPYVMVMADDNVVGEPMFEALLTSAERSGAGILAPKMYFKDDPTRIWSVGAKLSLTSGLCRFPHAGETDVGQCALEWEPDSVHNALYCARSAWERLGGLDCVNFAMHNEEADFCIRARREGIRVLVVPEAHLWHNVSSRAKGLKLGSRDFAIESPMRAYLTARNRTLLVRKHARLPSRLVFTFVFLPATTLFYTGVILTSKGNRIERLWAYLRGTLAGLRDPIALTS